MQIRKYDARDLKALDLIYYESRKASDWLDQARVACGEFQRDTEGESIWVCEERSGLVGFVSAWVQEKLIRHLHVAPHKKGKGFGRSLLWACLDEIGLPAHGKCDSRNIRALQFCRDQGWTMASGGADAQGNYELLLLPPERDRLTF